MNDLESIRKEIDKVDKEIITLFEKRMDLVKYVVDYKIKNNMKVLDSSRENLIIEKNKNLLQNKEYSQYLEDFFKSLMDISKDIQEKILKENINE
ncbi:chorismate mutase [Miniphocaeibacter halophilus]|uniref:Chorismate mutase n=1 Tax=Miniphocaeibacter halophilus TaxID=2931922 RepID=A0AC61MRG8_9FIRM|nr:chorismate mutase [Miniphocaeibacter halophilus]QQK08169.1 chorismate mutase [Miniphocaeibacter halophilus]